MAGEDRRRVVRWPWGLPWLILAWVGCGTPQVYLPPEQVGRYRLARVAAEQPAGRLSARDLDGDGAPELLLYREPALEVLRVDRAAERTAAWRRHRFTPEPFHRQWRDGRLLLFSQEGVAGYDPVTDRVSTLIDVELVPVRAAASPLLSGGEGLPSSARPLMRADVEELLLPLSRRHWAIYRRGQPGRWRLQDRIDLPASATDSKKLALPRRSRADLDGDGRADLVLHGARDTFFFYRRADGRLPKEADFRLRHDAADEKKIAAHTHLADLNADGFADLLQVSNRIGEPGRVAVYLGHPRRRAWRRADQRLEIPGFVSLGPILSDRDDDGQLDMTFVSAEKPGVFGTAFNLVFRGRFVLSVDILHYHGVEGGYPESPSASESIDFAVDLEKLKAQGKAIKERVVHLGDLDRDGRPDLALLSEDRRQLLLYYNFQNLSSARERSGVGRMLDQLRDMFAGLQNLADRRPDLTLALPGGPYEEASIEPVRFDRALKHPDLLLQARPREGKPVLFVLWSQR